MKSYHLNKIGLLIQVVGLFFVCLKNEIEPYCYIYFLGIAISISAIIKLQFE